MNVIMSFLKRRISNQFQIKINLIDGAIVIQVGLKICNCAISTINVIFFAISF